MIIRPKLMLNDRQIDISNLKDVRLSIVLEPHSGDQYSKKHEFKDPKFSETEDYILTFVVPADAYQIKVNLEGYVKPTTKDCNEYLEADMSSDFVTVKTHKK